MLIAEGSVTRCGEEDWTSKDGKKSGTAIRFSIEGENFLPDRTMTLADLPPVGAKVRALVHSVFMREKMRELWFVVGFESIQRPGDPSPMVQTVSANGHGQQQPVVPA